MTLNPDRSLAFTALLHYGGDDFGKLDMRLASLLVTDLLNHDTAQTTSPTFDHSAREYLDKHRGQLAARAERLALDEHEPAHADEDEQ